MYDICMKSKYIILDRDGTLIKHIPYLNDPEMVEILPNVIEGLQCLKSKGFKFGIISNQSGIARNKITTETVTIINDKIVELLESHFVHIDFIYFCPHMPENVCSCRKPKKGLGLKAIDFFEIDITLSYMVGDSDVDILFGKALGLKTIGIGYNQTRNVVPDYTTIDILEAAKLITMEMS
jgi:D-glycero-D-manno-heptose 1,7-bisphosphate phosphatase